MNSLLKVLFSIFYGLLVLSFIITNSCSWRPRSAKIVYSGNAKAPVVLSPDSKSCKTVYEKRLWLALFGAVALNSWEEERFFSNKNAAYRITEEMMWSDILITVLGGWAFSLSTRTLSIESCTNKFVVQSLSDQKKEIRESLSSWARGNDLRILTRGGKWISGILLEITSTDWKIQASPKLSDSKIKNQDRLILKNGQKLNGRLLSQNTKSIRFVVKGIPKRFLRSEIKKVEFESINSTQSINLIPIDSIQRVIFSPTNRGILNKGLEQ